MKVSYINIKDSLKQEPSSRLLFDSRIFSLIFFLVVVHLCQPIVQKNTSCQLV